MKRILIVDDSEMARNFHAYILRNMGFDAITAMDGSEALEKFFADPFDLVITDINMPLMDGYEFVRRIREEAQFEEIPIIIVSTEDEARDKQKGYEAGANIYIVKPTDPEQLVENVRLLMD